MSHLQWWKHRVASALVLLPLAGCGGGAAGHLPGVEDVLLITLDTARADKFSFAGTSSVATPSVDALAADGVAFLEAISPAPITLVAHASLMTGLWPPAHGVRNNGTYELGETAVTLAELLKAEGYRTAAFVGAAVLDSRYGLGQGFEHYDDEVYADKFHPERRGEEVVAAALSWLDSQPPGRAFVWVHLFDPHAPYDPPEPERSRHAGALYDGEIAYADRVVGRLLDGYRHRGRYEEAAIVVTADHGESLGEHGEETHGVFIYDATVRVPLVMRAPGLDPGLRITEQVSLVDLLPTVARLAGVAAPDVVQGRDLVPLARGDKGPPSPAYLESFLPRENHGWSELRGLRSRGWKLIVGAASEVYDLKADPAELEDLGVEEAERAASMRRALERGFANRGADTARPIEMDETTRRQLAALGYLSAGGSLPPRAPANEPAVLPDPRSRIHLVRARSTAAELFDRGFHRLALERMRAVLDQDPENRWIRWQYQKTLVATGALEEAEKLSLAAVQEDPADGRGQRLRAELLELLGRPGEAVEALAAALAADPQDREARRRRWRLLIELGESARVEGEATMALDADAADGGALSAVALARWGEEEAEGLLARLRSAAEASPTDPEIAATLGELLFRRGRLIEALEHQARAQSLAPTVEAYAFELARTLSHLSRPAEVRHVLRNVRKRALLMPEVWLQLGEACLDLPDLPCAVRALRRVGHLVSGPLGPWLDAGPGGPLAAPGRRRELIELAGRPAEIPAQAPPASERPAGHLRPAFQVGQRLLAAGELAEARSALEGVYRASLPGLEVTLAFAEVAALQRDFAALREALTLLTELLDASDGGTALLATAEPDRRIAALKAGERLSRIGNACWGAQEFWGAMQAYALGAWLVPSSPAFPYNEALAWERIGDLDEAARAFERTLVLEADFQRAQEHLDRVAELLATRRRPG